MFPTLTASDVLEYQFSYWYPIFKSDSIKSTIIKPLKADFIEYLHSESVFVPEGSEHKPPESTLSDDDDDAEEDDPPESDDEDQPTYSFPELDRSIRAAVELYGAVFPKLNFTSPKDASWILPSSSPLKCTCPADVYLLLKSSDFVTHDLELSTVFEGCDGEAPYELELVLRKWYPVDRAREFRCFVRHSRLIGICQRDINFYEYLRKSDTQRQITDSISTLWKTKIAPKWKQTDYVFDVLLTRDLSSGHIVDMAPYAPRTDPLLFTYEELATLEERSEPLLVLIDSPVHPAVTRNAPQNQHNMVPFEAISLSSGTDIDDFSHRWREEVKKSVESDDES